MPREKPLHRHWARPIARCIEDHVGPRLRLVRNRPLRGGKRNLHSPRDARAHIVAVEPFALNRGRVQYLRRKRLANRLLAHIEANGV